MAGSPPIKILHESPDFLVVSKPTPLVMHRDAKYKEGTLIDEVLVHYPEIASVGDEPSTRPGIIHRLDKGVSGVIVIARTQPFFEYLKEQFKQRLVQKIYHALVHGAVSKDEGDIKTFIGRAQSGHMAARAVPRRGVINHAPTKDKEAHTHYSVLSRFPHYTYLEIQPETGRMHQIRVHLNSIGHPIVGDHVYTSKRFAIHERSMRTKFPVLAERLWLHAYSLTFTDQANIKQTFTAPVPNVMMDVINHLRR